MTECSIEDCHTHSEVRGWCRTHYSRWQRHGDPMHLMPEAKDVECIVEDCHRPGRARGWCQKHYNRWSRHGDTDQRTPTNEEYQAMHFKKSIDDGFWDRVNRSQRRRILGV